ncbi:addiction module protein [Marinihelvus fidelis]|uniref:Addiction module protein n=1 Tax=Marinihelvus fidelis TaxID=2613842 RepID=A0A5N0T3L4_9GAMM|nr:addiction module protein [Marinihelvus fidelis]KAA9129660.1 addiction module protein [Marinihelvus fidelis]
MARTLDKIGEDIRGLSDSERDVLLRDLIANLDIDPELNLESVWLEAAVRRYAELQSGVAETSPADVVLEKARDRVRGAG